MNSSNGIVLWSMGAAGTLLVYSAYKNLKPQAVLAHYFTGTAYTASDSIQAGKPNVSLNQGLNNSGLGLLAPNNQNSTPNLPDPLKQKLDNSGLGLLTGAADITTPANYGSATYIGA